MTMAMSWPSFGSSRGTGLSASHDKADPAEHIGHELPGIHYPYATHMKNWGDLGKASDHELLRKA